MDHATHLRYLAATTDDDIPYNKSAAAGGSKMLTGYSDSDCGDDVKNRRSEMGYILVLNGSPVAWKSELLQDSVTVSPLEAEWTPMVLGIKHGLFMQEILKGIGISEGAIPWFCGNRGSIQSVSKIRFRGYTLSTWM